MRQVLLRSDGREMVAWLDDRKRFQLNDVVTLKNHPERDRLWRVSEIYGWKALEEIHADWHVGGL